MASFPDLDTPIPPDHRTTSGLLAEYYTLTVIALALVLLRAWVCLRLTRNWGWDDTCIVIAWVYISSPNSIRKLLRSRHLDRPPSRPHNNPTRSQPRPRPPRHLPPGPRAHGPPNPKGQHNLPNIQRHLRPGNQILNQLLHPPNPKQPCCALDTSLAHVIHDTNYYRCRRHSRCLLYPARETVE